jgi:hypothetical protein
MDSIYSNAEAEICAHWKKNDQYNNSYSDQKDGMASLQQIGQTSFTPT